MERVTELIKVFESKILQLEDISKINDGNLVNFRIANYDDRIIHNRFYNPRYDNSLFNSVTTCVHSMNDKRSHNYTDSENPKICENMECTYLHDCCGRSYASDGTEDHMDFVDDNCPERLKYIQQKTETEFSDDNTYSKPIPTEKDRFGLMQYRQRNIIRRNEIFRWTISINSIPILERNIERIDMVLKFEHAHREAMARIRCKMLCNGGPWKIEKEIGGHVTFIYMDIPNDVILEICRFCTF
jgi:hypothetical protein